MLFVNSKSVASYINARWMASSDAQNDIVLRIGGGPERESERQEESSGTGDELLS